MKNIIALSKKISICFGFYKLMRKISHLLRPEDKKRDQDQIEFYRNILQTQNRKNEKLLCFDIGANIGEKSEALINLDHRVISFEPNDDLIGELYARCSASNSWELCPVALGSIPKISSLYIRNYFRQASLIEEWGTGEIVKKKNIPVFTLDLVIEYFGKPDFVKIDVEGFEFEVLSGLSESIDLMAIEFHLDAKGIKATNKCIGIIEKLGDYEVNIIDGQSLNFLKDNWISLKEFKEIFPEQISHRYDMKESYGDIYFRKKIRP